MNSIDFQNGFIAGMATKGLIRSGELYKPICWNDEGIYSYFYIDFKRVMSGFSTGMFNDSIVVYDSIAIPVTQVQKVSSGVYKVFCDISDRLQGVTVMNKKTSRLRFATGERLPVFSVHFFVSGIAQYISDGYVYDAETLGSLELLTWQNEAASINLEVYMQVSHQEQTGFENPASGFFTSESASVIIEE